MKFLVKVTAPVDQGNAAIKDGSLASIIESIVDDLKPEAVYFSVERGQRTAYYFVEINDACDIPAFVEPFFLSLKCDVEVVPVMTPADLAKAGPHMETAVRKYG